MNKRGADNSAVSPAAFLRVVKIKGNERVFKGKAGKKLAVELSLVGNPESAVISRWPINDYVASKEQRKKRCARIPNNE